MVAIKDLTLHITLNVTLNDEEFPNVVASASLNEVKDKLTRAIDSYLGKQAPSMETSTKPKNFVPRKICTDCSKDKGIVTFKSTDGAVHDTCAVCRGDARFNTAISKARAAKEAKRLVGEIISERTEPLEPEEAEEPELPKP